MDVANLTCRQEHRREDVRAAALCGLDYVEIADEQQVTLNVFFLGKAPQKLEKANVVLTGGRRIRDVQITSVKIHRQRDATLDDYLEVNVNKAGDSSTYTIRMVNVVGGRATSDPMAGFDSRYSHVDFTFKAGCPTDLDCKPQCSCPPPVRTQPEINYLAKDYESFRQLILDRLAVIMPQWIETHVPDLGITLVELLAYAGDYLSYYQDAVATEAYLGTARERISVRRHARLVDYQMHDGCNARAWLTISTDQDFTFDDASQIYFITAYPGAPARKILTPKDLSGVLGSSYEVFEPLYWNGDGKNISIYQWHSKILFYTWGDCECCLAAGSTSATLVDAWDPDAPPSDSGGTTPGTPGTPTGTTPGTPSTPSGSTPGTPGTPSGIPATTPATTTGTTTPGTPRGSSAGVPLMRADAKAPPATLAKTVAAKSDGGDGPPGTQRRLRNLKVGDILIFEEVLGPKTGNPADADPTHRQAVRLTKVTPGIDPLYGLQPGTPIVEIEWASEDALTFPLCISSQQPAPDCGCMENVSVARGNVILVDNGGDPVEVLGTVPTDSTAPQCPKCCQPMSTTITPGQFRPALFQEPLTFAEPLPPACSAADFIRQDPRQALPAISLTSIPAAAQCPSASDSNQPQPPCQIPPLFTFDDFQDPTGLAKVLKADTDPNSQFLLAQLSTTTQQNLKSWDGSVPAPAALVGDLRNDLSALFETWSPQRDLLESGPNDNDFVVEMDNDGFGRLRFGDGTCGHQPEAGTLFRAAYRVGNGAAGNVGRDTIAYIVFRSETVSGSNLEPLNPMAAEGGVDPEPIADVKQFAPYSFSSQLERAITADDYAAIAADNKRRLEARAALESEGSEICTAPFTRLQGAKAALRWTGSWYTVLVALDPAGSETADAELVDEMTLYLEPFRRLGHDLLVHAAIYVPIKLSLTVCVLPNYQRGHVEAAVLNALSNRVLPDGAFGFFHPDKLTFGGGIYVSQILAAVQAIPGVQNAMVSELERFEISEPDPKVDQPGEELPLNSALLMGPFEIAQLDNDPSFPESGRLILDMRGGR